MSDDKFKIAYITSLLILASLLVLFAQGAFTGLYESSGKPVVEINRIDLQDDFLGNYSKVSIDIANNGTIGHNFSINTYYDGELADSFNITIKGGKTFAYSLDVLPDKIPISRTETIDSTLKVAKFVVYIDEQSDPFEQASFVFKE